jgi:hypothetical protein
VTNPNSDLELLGQRLREALYAKKLRMRELAELGKRERAAMRAWIQEQRAAALASLGEEVRVARAAAKATRKQRLDEARRLSASQIDVARAAVEIERAHAAEQERITRAHESRRASLQREHERTLRQAMPSSRVLEQLAPLLEKARGFRPAPGESRAEALWRYALAHPEEMHALLEPKAERLIAETRTRIAAAEASARGAGRTASRKPVRAAPLFTAMRKVPTASSSPRPAKPAAKGKPAAPPVKPAAPPRPAQPLRAPKPAARPTARPPQRSTPTQEQGAPPQVLPSALVARVSAEEALRPIVQKPPVAEVSPPPVASPAPPTPAAPSPPPAPIPTTARSKRSSRSRPQLGLFEAPLTPREPPPAASSPPAAAASALAPSPASAPPSSRARNPYEQKRAARIERQRARAGKLRAEAETAYARGRAIGEMIPMGQPILVGHHSERRHRRDLGKMDKALSSSAALSREADELERRANRAEKSGAISSDDPEAIPKLREKLAAVEQQRERMRKANAVIRQGGGDVLPKLQVLGFNEGAARKLREPDPMGRVGFPPYAMQNASNEATRIKQRIADLEKRTSSPARPPETIGGATISESDNRVRIVFPCVPDEAVRKSLKGVGFRWSPTAGAWQRMASAAAWFEAKRVVAAQATSLVAPSPPAPSPSPGA